MEKNEILMKAQQENKGKDVADLEAQKRGTSIAFMVGGLAFIAIIVVELLVTGVMHYGNHGWMLHYVSDCLLC